MVDQEPAQEIPLSQPRPEEPFMLATADPDVPPELTLDSPTVPEQKAGLGLWQGEGNMQGCPKKYCPYDFQPSTRTCFYFVTFCSLVFTFLRSLLHPTIAPPTHVFKTCLYLCGTNNRHT